MNKVIEQGWRSYAERVLPGNAPEVQRRECKNAFYAGALISFGGVINVMSKCKNPTEADFDMIDDMAKELEEYPKTVLRGKH